jgi:hypothetical protein
MMRNSIAFILGVTYLVSVGCSRKITESFEKFPKIKDEVLLHAVDSMSSQKYSYFYSKISTDYKDSTQNISFKTSIRVVADSAMNALITYASIPIINAVVTTDSMKLTNKRDKCYTLQSLNFIKESFGVAFSSKNVEELITGMPLGFDSSAKYYQEEDSRGYLLTSHRKKDIRKNERKDQKEVIQSFVLDSELKTLKETIIESPIDTAIVKIEYLTREFIDGINLPATVKISITTPRKEIQINMDYKKTRLNEVETIYFVIPEEYEECK